MKEPIYRFIDINEIIPNKRQPRTHFEKEKLHELAVSIQENGLVQPIVVRPYEGHYQIVVGERRYRACQLAGLQEIPCIVRELDQENTGTIAVVENIQREDLSPIEEALAYQQLIDTFNYTQQELADKVGKKQSTIANKLRLLQLPMTVQEAIKKKEITERHGRALLKLGSTGQKNNMLREILNKNLTVEQTEKRVETILKPQKTKPKTKSISQNLKIAFNTLDQALSMIKQSGVQTFVVSQDTEDEIIYTIKIKK